MCVWEAGDERAKERAREKKERLALGGWWLGRRKTREGKERAEDVHGIGWRGWAEWAGVGKYVDEANM